MRQNPSFLSASHSPQADIMRIAYPGQDPKRRMYRGGYEAFFNAMPNLLPDDPMLNLKVDHSVMVMDQLAGRLRAERWIAHNPLGADQFDRTIIAMESPAVLSDGSYKEGAELIVARWGDGYTSPVHGHAPGLLYENVLFGKMRVNTYRMISDDADIVRPLTTWFYEPGTLISQYAKPIQGAKFKRQSLIHNFTSLGFSASLHYVAEHTRDGRDNTFRVEHFADTYNLDENDVQEISAQGAIYLPKGEVVLVRTSNIPDLGDHYIVITGSPVMKPWGLRPQDVALQAPDNKILQQRNQDFVLLKLRPTARNYFHEFHGITVNNREVIFPTAQ